MMGIAMAYMYMIVCLFGIACLVFIVLAYFTSLIAAHREGNTKGQTSKPTEVHYHDHRQITINNHPPEQHYHDHRQVTVNVEPSLMGGFAKALTGQAQTRQIEKHKRMQIEDQYHVEHTRRIP